MPATSNVTIEGNIVTKTLTDQYLKHGIYENEKHWLQKFSDAEINVPFPVLLGFDNHKTISMSYCGKRITYQTVPYDWYYQANNILGMLEFFGCSHNDIKPEEILVKNGKLYLCDFGWATKYGELLPDTWPKKIGGDFRYCSKEHECLRDDKYSLYRSIEHVLAKG